jgi:hypothetical protein
MAGYLQAVDPDASHCRAGPATSHAGPATPAVFPTAKPGRGMYESFYLRAVDPRRPRGVWIRYTVHKRPGEAPLGSLWLTYFDAQRPAPFAHKLTTSELSVPGGGWIAVGADAAFGPGGAHGACGGARWELGLATAEPPLWHLPRRWMYRAPLPRTKLSSPAPAARFTGTLVVPGPDATAAPLAAASGTTAAAPTGSPAAAPPETIELEGWPGMVGHNWGAEHAERWIWLHGISFAQDPDAWLDVAIGRIRVAGRTTPWVANGAIALGGERHWLGGPARRGLLVAEAPGHCRLSLPGPGGLTVQAHVHSPAGAIAGWRYADPDGGGHEVANCSIAELALTVHQPGEATRTLHTAHGAAYELGMRGGGHGVALAPFADG